MAHISDPRGSLAAESDRITRAQAIFAAVGIGIIISGLWFVAQTNAPYHPEVLTAEDALIFAADD